MQEKAIKSTSNDRERLFIGMLFAFALLLPIFPLPQPGNVASIPWKTEFAFSVCFLIWLARCRASGFDVFPKPVRISFYFAAGLSLLSLISFAWAQSWFSALHHALVWVNYALIFAATFALIRHYGRFDIVAGTLATIAIILFALIAFDLITMVDFSVQEGTIRIRYAKFAEMLVTFAPLLFAVSLFRKSKGKWSAAILPAVFAWMTTMLSLSKGAFLSGVVGLVTFFIVSYLFSPRIFRRRIILGFSIWVAVTLFCQIGFSFFSSVPATAQYISGAADATRSTTSMRVFNWNLTWEMFKEHPVFGVGADNFGVNVNNARAIYADRNPDDPNLEIGEDYIFERAHNEPLQILAELGIVGFSLFAAFALFSGGFLLQALLRNRGHASPMFIAAIAGCLAFAISSMFSSFSFRAFQNGVVFFIVLGVAFAFAPGTRSTRPSGRTSGRKWILVPLVAVVLLVAYSASKGVAQYSLYFAERAASAGEARSLLNTSLTADRDLAGAYLSLASIDKKESDPRGVTENIEKAIHGGLGISQIFSNLAEAYADAGDLDRAEASLRRGISVFPRSIFLRARLVETLRMAGRHDEAGSELETARSIDLKQANGWNAVLSEGILNAHLKAQADPTFAKPPDLKPAGSIAIYAGRADDIPKRNK